MQNTKIATVFSFCSNDWRFFDRCIEGARPFSSQILVTVCDHFFDGTPENYALLEEIFRRYPDITFIEFAYSSERTYSYTSMLSLDHPLTRHEWHNTGRWISYFFADAEYLYFCDSDEITDGKRFAEWLLDFEPCTAMRFACYWYFRDASYRAREEDDMCLLVKKDQIDPNLFWNEHERMGLYLTLSGKKKIHVRGIDGDPLVHHYSWVRTKEEMHKKFASWGHFWERDWKRLVEEEYARPFNGVDFIRKYNYQNAEPFFDPLQVEPPRVSPVSFEEHLNHVKLFDNVTRVSVQEMFRKEVKHVFSL